MALQPGTPLGPCQIEAPSAQAGWASSAAPVRLNCQVTQTR